MNRRGGGRPLPTTPPQNQLLVLQNRNATIIQREVKAFLLRKRWATLVDDFCKSESAKPLRLRLNKLKELISSENTYVTGLTSIIEEYYKPIKELVDTSSCISNEEFQKIFLNIFVIENFQRIFYTDLKEQYDQYPAKPIVIGKVIETLAPFFKIYTTFVNNYQHSCEILTNLLKNNQEFSQWVETKYPRDQQLRNLSSLLITPIQRIPRYRLLIEELLKSTAPDHVDYQPLKNALDAILRLAQYINETKRSTEIRDIIGERQSTIKGMSFNLAHEKRKIVKEGKLVRITDTGSNEREFILFSDLLLAIDKRSKSEEIYDGYILLRDADVQFSNKIPTHFKITFKNKKVITYSSSSTSEILEWVNTITEAIKEINKTPKEQSPDALLEIEHFAGGSILKSGILKVREPTNLTLKTRSRWFVLMKNVLYYKKSESESELRGGFQLENYNVNLFDKLQFNLINTETDYVAKFYARTDIETQAWVHSILEAKVESKKITDLKLIKWEEHVIPLGYTPILESYHNELLNLSYNSHERIILCVERNGLDEEKNPKLPITGVTLLIRDKKDPFSVPVGWSLLDNTVPCISYKDKELYILIQRIPGASPVSKISFYSKNDTCPPRYIEIKHTGKNDDRYLYICPFFMCCQKENEDEFLLQRELGWDASTIPTPENIPNKWKKFVDAVGVDKKNPQQIKKAILEGIKLLKNSENQGATTVCFNCSQEFSYESGSASFVECPFCQTLNAPEVPGTKKNQEPVSIGKRRVLSGSSPSALEQLAALPPITDNTSKPKSPRRATVVNELYAKSVYGPKKNNLGRSEPVFTAPTPMLPQPVNMPNYYPPTNNLPSYNQCTANYHPPAPNVYTPYPIDPNPYPTNNILYPPPMHSSSYPVPQITVNTSTPSYTPPSSTQYPPPLSAYPPPLSAYPPPIYPSSPSVPQSQSQPIYSNISSKDQLTRQPGNKNIATYFGNVTTGAPVKKQAKIVPIDTLTKEQFDKLLIDVNLRLKNSNVGRQM